MSFAIWGHYYSCERVDLNTKNNCNTPLYSMRYAIFYKRSLATAD